MPPRASSKTPEIPRVAFYARCSDIKQAEKELSIPAQLLACEKEARRRGWEPTARYIEAAESAKSADRPVFQQMIADVRKKKKDFDYILVWKFSRFARSRADSVLYKSMLQRCGVKLVSLNEPVDDSPTGRMLEGILESVDEFYSENLAQDTVRGMRLNASLGYRNGGVVPTGYIQKRTGTELSPKNKLDPDPVWGPVVQRMLRMALAGEGVCNIAAALHAEGLQTPRGKPWQKQTILHMLRNEVYTGVSEWGRERTGLQVHKEADPVRTENMHPALVSREDCDAVQRLLGERTRERIHPRRLGSSYLLSGLLWCGGCQAPFIGHPAKGGEHHYYGCQRKMKTGAASCPSKLLPQGEAELAVIDLLRREVLTPTRLAELTALVNADLDTAADTTTADLKSVDAQIADARGRLGRLYAALETGALELSELAPRIREWKGKLDALEIRRASLIAKAEIKARPVMDAATVTAYLRELSALLATGPLAARKAFLRSFIQRIDATGYDLAVTYNLPPLPEPDGGLPAPANEPGGEVPLRRAAGAEGADLRVGGGLHGLGSPDAEKADARLPRVLPFGKDGSTKRRVHEPHGGSEMGSGSSLSSRFGRAARLNRMLVSSRWRRLVHVPACWPAPESGRPSSVGCPASTTALTSRPTWA